MDKSIFLFFWLLLLPALIVKSPLYLEILYFEQSLPASSKWSKNAERWVTGATASK